jgi:adenine-specific DNA-methyltransferase
VAEKITRKANLTPVRAYPHPSDSRPNIPTAELESFARPDEKRPATVRYPRDPTLDPQLVWKGKDEQDAHDLEVPAVPIYIQETIDPLALIEELRAESEGRRSEQQLGFFGPYSELSFEEKVDFYRHAGKWTNRMILGDSLLVMTSLAEKEGLKGQVQTIYVDPPYGIKFGSNWQVSTRKRDVRDGKDTDLTRQPEQVRAYRDTWELGIHSYLSYLRDRLAVARDLLTDSGSIFVQIGEDNVHTVRSLLDETFGSDNAFAFITFKKTSAVGSFAGGTVVLPSTCDFILGYARDKESLKYRQLFLDKDPVGAGGTGYTLIELPDGTRRAASSQEREAVGRGTGRLFGASPLVSETVRTAQTTVFPVEVGGRTFLPRRGGWKTNPHGMRNLQLANRLYPQDVGLRFARYHDDFPAFPLTNLWTDTQSGSAMDKTYVVQTNQKVIERCLLMTTDPGDLVLDPTCGSGTTAYVAEQWGRRWITIDTSRVALALARSRLMAAKYPFYLLADSESGARKEAEVSGVAPPVASGYGNDVRRGFVYQRVPHVTLKSIAQNPDIREGMSRDEIDAAIARHADTETLFDRPYEDRKIVRVSGPFTVESLSPHRVLRDGPEDEAAEPPPSSTDSGQFVTSILDNLRRAGVQNTKRNERLEFSRLEPYPGVYIQATGEYPENGHVKTAAVAIGPEFGTVGPELIREAAKEAVKVADLLVVAGFAFDPRAGEESSALGRLTVLQARISPDLLVGGLKATGAGNLFQVFGEPDIELREADNDQLVVEIRGLDVYDPTTGQLRSSSVDDIAAWFLDTDYDGDAYFVRHAYFTGADDPYDRLRRALKADISDEAWATVNSTVSRPLPRPRSGKIAIKVINHYGDEVMKVIGLDHSQARLEPVTPSGPQEALESHPSDSDVKPLYVDIYDTARTIDQTNQWAARGSLFTSVLTGEDLVFSQAQSFDSVLLLRALEDVRQREALLQLVGGPVQFRLYDADTIWEAFGRALAKPGFIFSAWPELMNDEEASGSVRRIVDATPPDADGVRWGTRPPTPRVRELRARIEGLHRLSREHPQTAEKALNLSHELRGRVQAKAEELEASSGDHEVADLLRAAADEDVSTRSDLRNRLALNPPSVPRDRASFWIDVVQQELIAHALKARPIISGAGTPFEDDFHHANRSSAAHLGHEITDFEGLRVIDWPKLVDYYRGVMNTKPGPDRVDPLRRDRVLAEVTVNELGLLGYFIKVPGRRRLDRAARIGAETYLALTMPGYVPLSLSGTKLVVDWFAKRRTGYTVREMAGEVLVRRLIPRYRGRLLEREVEIRNAARE